MRRIRYIVAMSVDGYIAGPNGESASVVALGIYTGSAKCKFFDIKIFPASD
jgi:hypothetical protein